MKETTLPSTRQGFEAGYKFAASIIRPAMRFLYKTHIEGLEVIPRHGPAIIAVNHISLFDPIPVAYAVDKAGRHPRFLGKSSLFKAPFVGAILRSARQIKVERASSLAVGSLRDAERGLAEGEVLVIFPEGTTTMAPDLAPIPPKTGVARLTLASGVPVIPCATWGGQWVWGYHLGFRPGLKKDLWVRFGRPLSFDHYASRIGDRAALDEIGVTIMDEIGSLLVGLKAAKPWTPTPPKKGKKSAR